MNRMKIVSAVRCECMWNGNHNLAPNENIILQKLTLDFPSAFIHVAIEISQWTIVRVLVHYALVASFIFVSFSFCEFIQNGVRWQLKANAIHYEAIYSKHDVCIGMPSIVLNCMHRYEVRASANGTSIGDTATLFGRTKLASPTDVICCAQRMCARTFRDKNLK